MQLNCETIIADVVVIRCSFCYLLYHTGSLSMKNKIDLLQSGEECNIGKSGLLNKSQARKLKLYANLLLLILKITKTFILTYFVFHISFQMGDQNDDHK